jgi:predicted AAA+ superfamily ATPase
VLLDFTFGSFKGYVAENFVLQEMTVTGKGNRVAWRENTAEVEFLWELDGYILPIEVKSGWITQAKSLKVYAEKYKPNLRVTLCAKNFSVDRDKGAYHIPLYLAARLAKIMKDLE